MFITKHLSTANIYATVLFYFLHVFFPSVTCIYFIITLQNVLIVIYQF